MPSVDYSYQLSTTCSGGVNIDALSYEVRSSSIKHSLHYVYVDNDSDNVTVWFRDTLDVEDEAILLYLLQNHRGLPLSLSLNQMATMSGIIVTDTDKTLIINEEGRAIGVSQEMPFHVTTTTINSPHYLNSTSHSGILGDSQIPSFITRDSELFTVSGILNDKIYALDFYTTNEVDTIVSGLAVWDHDHDLRYIKINNQSVIDHGLISGLNDNDHPQYLLNTNFTIYSGTLQNQIDGKAPIVHYHDDRYYTETELNNGQLNNIYYTEAEVNNISGSLQFQIDNFAGGMVVHDNTWHSEPYATTSYVSTVSGVLQNQINNLTPDHGTLSGLADDDHTQYVLSNGTRDITGTQVFQQNVVIQGNLVVSGTQIVADVETVQIEDNLLLLNKGEPGAGVTERYSGLEIDRGSLTDYLMVFDENNDTMYAGISGSLQPVAFREESPISSGIALWNSTATRFDTVAQRTAFNKDFGTVSGTIADGAHTHPGGGHDRLHAITSTADHSAGINKVFYSDNSGVITELPIGTSGTVLYSNGTSIAPVFKESKIIVYTIVSGTSACITGLLSSNAVMGTTWGDISWGTITHQNAPEMVKRDDVNTDRFYFYEDGTYVMALNLTAVCNGGKRVDARTIRNDTTVISGSEFYLVDSSSEQIGVQFSFDVVAGDFITLQGMAQQTADYFAAGGRICITRIGGMKGDDGLPGEHGHPGAGSNVNVLNNGTLVAGSPFTELNFINASSIVSGTITSGTVDINIQPAFGSAFSQSSLDAETSTTSAGYNQRLRHTVSNLQTGTYRVGWYAELKCSAVNSDYQFRIQQDDTTDLGLVNVEVSDATTYESLSGFVYVSLSPSTTYNFDLDYGPESGGVTVYIRRARIEFWRVS